MQQNKPQKQIAQVTAIRQYSGPLPPPEQLQIYEQVLPGAANRILTMAENENKHRHNKENKALNGTILNERFGMASALFVCLSAITAGVYCISKDNALAGSFMSAIPLAGIVIAFIRGRSHNNK